MSPLDQPDVTGVAPVSRDWKGQLRTVILSLLQLPIPTLACAQSVSIGVTGGVPLSSLATATEGMASTTFKPGDALL